MICYKDKTFCGSDCTNQQCGRFFSELDKQKARRWWGSDDAPVAYSDFSKGCSDYVKPEVVV